MIHIKQIDALSKESTTNNPFSCSANQISSLDQILLSFLGSKCFFFGLKSGGLWYVFIVQIIIIIKSVILCQEIAWGEFNFSLEIATADSQKINTITIIIITTITTIKVIIIKVIIVTNIMMMMSRVIIIIIILSILGANAQWSSIYSGLSKWWPSLSQLSLSSSSPRSSSSGNR